MGHYQRILFKDFQKFTLIVGINKMSTFKKLAYKSHYRGTKEGDYLLSSFAKYELENCSEQAIKMYEQLLDYTDTEIQEWVMSPQKTPTLLKEIILKIAAFHKLN